jgi:uncharacterized membrane-anchored protein YhcB (DUF1043 family)
MGDISKIIKEINEKLDELQSVLDSYRREIDEKINEIAKLVFVGLRHQRWYNWWSDYEEG